MKEKVKLPEHDFKFSSTNDEEVLKYIKYLDNSSPPGNSGIPVSILKAASHIIVSPIVDLFNQCILQGKFPTEWKTAVVTPLFKNKGVPTDLNNYRGISVLPPLCKVFEHILAKQIRAHFDANNLFYFGQHGFRANHSCESALHEIISSCLTNLDKKLVNLLLFIDFKKAFDMVDSNLLIYKLLNYRFSNIAIKLIQSYFEDRYQCTKLGVNLSKKARLRLGVPQGSVLGPLLFIIFINDLAFFLTLVLAVLFADDTSLLFTGVDLDKTISYFRVRLKQLNEWCKHNRLYINWSKTFIMIVSNKRILKPDYIEFDGIKIGCVKTFKLLGVHIDDKLHFDAYVAHQCLTINKKFYAIKRLFYLPLEVKLQFFKPFCLPYFDYCISLCIYFSKSLLTKLCKCYYSSLFKLFKFNLVSMEIETVNDYLKRYNLFAFQYRLFYRLSLFFYKCKTENDAPEILKNELNPEFKSFSYALRKPSNFEEKKYLNKYSLIILKNVCAKWCNIVWCNSFNNYKLSEFKKFLLTNLTALFNNFIKKFDKFNIINCYTYFYY